MNHAPHDVRTGRIPAAEIAQHEAKLLAIAREHFYADGFERATIEAIARAARVSPKTIYGRYGNKAGLFGAAIRPRATTLLEPLGAPISSGDDVSAALLAFARRLLLVTTSPEMLLIHRLVVGESARFPEFGREFYEAGPKRGIATLAAFLERASAAGFVRIDEPHLTAEMFAGALVGLPVRDALLMQTRPSRHAIARRSRSVVAMFMAAYGIGTPLLMRNDAISTAKPTSDISR